MGQLTRGSTDPTELHYESRRVWERVSMPIFFNKHFLTAHGVYMMKMHTARYELGLS